MAASPSHTQWSDSPWSAVAAATMAEATVLEPWRLRIAERRHARMVGTVLMGHEYILLHTSSSPFGDSQPPRLNTVASAIVAAATALRGESDHCVWLGEAAMAHHLRIFDRGFLCLDGRQV